MVRICVLFIVTILFLTLSACEDEGTAVPPAPVITSVTPDSGKAGDTVTIAGSNFGSARGTSTVSFGTVNASQFVQWNGSSIKAIVPAGAATGTASVAVSVTRQKSNGKSFKVLAVTSAAVSYASDIVPIINAYSCKSCHGAGSTFNNFNITSYTNMMLGNSSNGPVVSQNNGANSVIVKKLLGTAGFGARMPQDGPPYLTTAEIQKFIDWIDQGAKNN